MLIVSGDHVHTNQNLEKIPSGDKRIHVEPVIRARLEMCSKQDQNRKVVHQLIRREILSARHCAFCKLTGTKFASGWIRKSYFKCDVCEVFLCKDPKRNCFYNFHKYVKSSADEEFEIQNYMNIL
jgi:hypothetical protein